MASLNSYAAPPFRHVTRPPGEQISPSAALLHIQEYLEETRTSAHLHPDALFTEVGITYAGSASTGGIVLHQLRRVEKGLQGVWLGKDLDFEDGPAEWNEEIPAGDGGQPNAQVSRSAGQKNGLEEELAGEGSSPRRNYQEQLRDLGEGIIEGEVGVRNNATSGDGEEPFVQSTKPSKKRRHAEIETETPGMDKEARKRAKAERRKKEKRERNLERERKGKEKTLDDMDDEEVLLNGTIHDETRDEHDEAEPSAHRLPEKISSTITKTPEEIGVILPDEPPSTDSPRKKKKEKRRHKEIEHEKAPGTPPRQVQFETDVHEITPQMKKRKKKENEEVPKTKQTSAGLREEHSASKSSVKAQVNGDTPSKPRKVEKDRKSNGKDQDRKENSQDQLLVPSSSNDTQVPLTPKKMDAEVVAETPPTKTNGHMILNGELPPLSQWSESEPQDLDRDEAKAKRREERRLKKELKKRAKEEKHAEKAKTLV